MRSFGRRVSRFFHSSHIAVASRHGRAGVPIERPQVDVAGSAARRAARMNKQPAVIAAPIVVENSIRLAWRSFHTVISCRHLQGFASNRFPFGLCRRRSSILRLLNPMAVIVANSVALVNRPRRRHPGTFDHSGELPPECCTRE
jgi:hypothetical protein